MAQKPRTPVHFPRMKVRGRRNKAKLSARRKHRTVFPHVALVLSPDRRSASAVVLASWQPGCQRLEIERVVDGYGRSVPGTRPSTVVRPADEPRPEPTFSARIRFKDGLSHDLWDSLFGRDRDGEG